MKLRAAINHTPRCSLCNRLVLPGQEYYIYPGDMHKPFDTGIGDKSDKIHCSRCEKKLTKKERGVDVNVNQ